MSGPTSIDTHRPYAPFLLLKGIDLLTLPQLQREIAAWSEHNFGDNDGLDSVAPLLGVVEEIGELFEAVTEAAMRDALADAAIFFCDFCNREGVDIATLIPHHESMHDPSRFDDPTAWLVVSAGRLAHAVLKHRQGIRAHGATHSHWEARNDAIVRAYLGLCAYSQVEFEEALLRVVEPIWQEVRKRDWKTYPLTGLPD